MKMFRPSFLQCAGLCVLLAAAMAAMSLFSGGAVYQRQANTQVLSNIIQNLKAQNINVVSAGIKQASPLRIKIALDDTGDAMTNAINIHMARREAALAYRNGIPVNSVEYSIPGASDPRIWWGESFFYANDQARFGAGFNKTNIGAEQISKDLSPRLDALSKTLIVNAIEVIKLPLADNEGKAISVAAIAVSSDDIALFLAEARNVIAETNKTGSNISILRVKIFDPHGRLLLNYFWDEEMKAELSLASPGIDSGRPNPPVLLKN